MAIPLLDLAYFPIQMRVIDIVSAIEHRNPFAYIVHHEFALLVGRIFGCGLFLILAMCVSRPFALRYALLTVGLVQLFSIVVARSVAEGCIALDKRGSEADLRSQSPYDLTFAG